MKISKKQARNIIIKAAGLHRNAVFGSGKSGVFKAINHLGYVQIDTISVIHRAHHHVLASRVPNYQKSHLFKLLAEAKILEYWSHAAAYLPMSDYRFTLPIKKYFKQQKDPWPKSDQKLKQRVLDRIKMEGPLMARDFESDRKRQGEGWWDWKPAKLALERLFLEGSLMTVGRKGFQKIYDLPERVIPQGVDVSAPTDDQYAAYLLARALQSLGLASLNEICYLRKGIKPIVKKWLAEKIESKLVEQVEVQGLEHQVYFANRSALQLPARVQKQLHILSPFDNLTIQRNRLSNFFNYEYQIECYVPPPKRKWGYFCLPLLYGDLFIGRVDIKADRKTSELIIRNLHLEGTAYQKIPVLTWQKSFVNFARFNDCGKISLLTCSDPNFELRDPGA